MVSVEELCYNLAGERRQIPRCKQRGIKLAAPQRRKGRVFDLRGIRQRTRE